MLRTPQQGSAPISGITKPKESDSFSKGCRNTNVSRILILPAPVSDGYTSLWIKGRQGWPDWTYSPPSQPLPLAVTHTRCSRGRCKASLVRRRKITWSCTTSHHPIRGHQSKPTGFASQGQHDVDGYSHQVVQTPSLVGKRPSPDNGEREMTDFLWVIQNKSPPLL